MEVPLLRRRRRRRSVTVLVAWDSPSREAVARDVTAEAVARAFRGHGRDEDRRLRAALDAAEHAIRAHPIARDAVPGTLGIGIAILDGDVGHVITRGAIEAFLVQGARMRPLDPPVVRVRLSVGDTLVLASRDLLRDVGPEELKSAALALHPAAVEASLRRIFATGGGRGSDAVSAISLDPDPEPVPGRRSRTRSVHPAFRPSRSVPVARRAALGVMSFSSVLAIVGLLVVILPRGDERAAAQGGGANPGSGLAPASDLVARAGNVMATDGGQALDLYRDAWRMLDAPTVPEAQLHPQVRALAARIRSGLDAIHGASIPEIRVVAALDPDEREPAWDSLVRGPDDALYLIDRVASVVSRVDLEDGRVIDVVHRGDPPATGKGRLGRPVQLASTPAGILVLDDAGRTWTWEPGDRPGKGALRGLDLGDDEEERPASVGDIVTYPDANGFRVYLVDIAAHEILRYQPTFDGRTFTRSDYLVSDDETVGELRQLHVDDRLYALGPDGIRRYRFGRIEHYRMATPPDDADLRPGRDYQLLAGTYRPSHGLLYLYDAAWDRIVVFDKLDGSYVRQWVAPPDGGMLDGVVGLSVTSGNGRTPDTMHWITPSAVLEAVVPSAAEPPDDAPTGDRARSERRGKGRARRGRASAPHANAG